MLKEGDNHIEAIINSIKTTVTVNIDAGIARKINAYIGITNKIVQNRIRL